MAEVVKVQRPLFGGPAWPVYAKGRRRMQELRPAPEEVVRAMGSDGKGHFKAEHKGGAWVIGKRVADQDW